VNISNIFLVEMKEMFCGDLYGRRGMAGGNSSGAGASQNAAARHRNVHATAPAALAPHTQPQLPHCLFLGDISFPNFAEKGILMLRRRCKESC